MGLCWTARFILCYKCTSFHCLWSLAVLTYLSRAELDDVKHQFIHASQASLCWTACFIPSSSISSLPKGITAVFIASFSVVPGCPYWPNKCKNKGNVAQITWSWETCYCNIKCDMIYTKLKIRSLWSSWKVQRILLLAQITGPALRSIVFEIMCSWTE
jgi:hypothetical protein